MIGIVTDSAASIDPVLLASTRICVVPMQLELDGRPLSESGTSVEAVDDVLAGRVAGRVETSAPSPGAFLEAMTQSDQGDGVVLLTVSAKMSGTFAAARLAAGLSDAKVEVVDTGTAAGAEGLVALAAHEEAAAGGSYESVVKQAALASGRVRMVATVGDLRPLSRSGRLPAPLARLGNKLGLRPVFQYRHGSISVLRPALSDRGAMEALVSAWRESVPGNGDAPGPSDAPGHRLHVCATYGDDRRGAESLIDAVAEKSSPATAYVARFGPVIVAHTGTDIVGLSWWWEPSA